MRPPLRNPKAVVWFAGLYGPAIVLVGFGAWIAIGGEWQSGLAYGIAALNIWVVASRMRTSYQAGYWRGRLDVQMEQWQLKAPRRFGVDREVEPWDEQPSLREATALRAAMEALAREQDNG